MCVTHKMRHTPIRNFTLPIREIIRGLIKTGNRYQGSMVTLRVSQVFKGACMGVRGDVVNCPCDLDLSIFTINTSEKYEI